MESKADKPVEAKDSTHFEFISSGTTAMACASGGALIGTTIAGPVGGVIGAVASGVVGFWISGSQPPHPNPHDK